MALSTANGAELWGTAVDDADYPDGRVYVRSTAYAAAFDFSVPDLKLEPPRFVTADKLRLISRAVNGASIDPNRLAAMEIRSTTNLALSLTQWIPLTNNLVFTNGEIRIDDVDSGSQPRRFFILGEPK